MMPRYALFLALAFTCPSLAACETPQPETLCERMARQCGGADPESWLFWCTSGCVPEHARTVPCEANDQCLLCDAPAEDDRTIYFGLPSEIEYLWTQLDPVGEPTHPAVEPAPTGGAFHDGPDSWSVVDTHHGAWLPIEPYDVVLGSPGGFCEPGPNQFVRRNVTSVDDAIVLHAERMPEEFFDMFCDYPNCPWGPYADCGGSLGMCQYGDAPEAAGVGSGSQADRTDGSSTLLSYGFGRYRTVMRAGDDATPPSPGFVYALFSQDNAYCVDGAPNLETNTSEVDIELSSGPGRAETEVFCDETEMCFQVSTWVSSTQGIGNGTRGVQRHEVSGFRFRSAETAGRYRTYGWDWRSDEVRFTYDADPDDCDERTGGCAPEDASVAICRHTRFVPRRPSPLHLQLWNARWAGRADPGARAALSVRDVWHEPAE